MRDLTCELHSAVIPMPLPWSCHHANQKVSAASAYASLHAVFPAADGLECRKARAEARQAQASLFSSLAPVEQ